MAVFDNLDAMAARASRRVFGETFTVSPRAVPARSVNKRGGADVARAAATFVAEFFEYFSRADMQDGGSARALSALTASNLAQAAGHSSARMRIKYSLTALPYALVKDDRVVRTKTGAVYRVAEVRLGADGNMTADLNIVEPAP